MRLRDIFKMNWKIIQNSLNKWNFSMCVNFCYLDEELPEMGSKRPNKGYRVPNNGPFVMIWWAVSKIEVIGPLYFEEENVTGETYKRRFLYYASPNLWNYPETSFLTIWCSSVDFHCCESVFEPMVPQTWMERAAPITLSPWSPDFARLTTFHGNIWKILYPGSLRTHLQR